MKNDAAKNLLKSAPAFAVAVELVPTHDNPVKESATDVEKRMLLFRLSDAATRIREESALIRRTAFTDPSGRLMRILGETIEEQRLSVANALNESVQSKGGTSK